MGLMTELLKASYDDGTVIEIDAKLNFGSLKDGLTRYRLIIENKTVDLVKGYLGTYTLRGSFQGKDNESKLVFLRINQGLFTTNYQLQIDGKEYPLIRVY